MKILLFNDTDHVWKRHAAGYGPAEIPPRTGAVIICDKELAFVKVWEGIFLVRGTTDGQFAADIGNAVGATLEPQEVQ